MERNKRTQSGGPRQKQQRGSNGVAKNNFKKHVGSSSQQAGATVNANILQQLRITPGQAAAMRNSLSSYTMGPFPVMNPMQQLGLWQGALSAAPSMVQGPPPIDPRILQLLRAQQMANLESAIQPMTPAQQSPTRMQDDSADSNFSNSSPGRLLDSVFDTPGEADGTETNTTTPDINAKVNAYQQTAGTDPNRELAKFLDSYKNDKSALRYIFKHSQSLLSTERRRSKSGASSGRKNSRNDPPEWKIDLVSLGNLSSVPFWSAAAFATVYSFAKAYPEASNLISDTQMASVVASEFPFRNRYLEEACGVASCSFERTHCLQRDDALCRLPEDYLTRKGACLTGFSYQTALDRFR